MMMALALPTCGEVLLDDTWADGALTDTSLPAESAWFSSATPGHPGESSAVAQAMTGSASRPLGRHPSGLS